MITAIGDLKDIKKDWRFEINGHAITDGALFRILRSLDAAQSAELAHGKMLVLSEAYILYKFNAGSPTPKTIGDGWHENRDAKVYTAIKPKYRNIRDDHDGIWRNLIAAGWPSPDYGRHYHA